MTPLLMLLTAHFFADFVCQSNWMAQGKSKWWEPLTVHVVVYSGVMTLLMPSGPYPFFQVPLSIVASWFAVTFVTHWLTDFVTSRINAKLWEQKRVHGFFVGVGADQLIHAWTLALTWQWLVQP